MDYNDQTVIRVPIGVDDQGNTIYEEMTVEQFLSLTGYAGRAVFCVAPKSDFNFDGNNDPNRFNPYSGEIVTDYDSDETKRGHVYVAFTDQNGIMRPYSKTKELEDRINALDYAGYFKQIESINLNNKIYRMFVDNTRLSVRLDSDLIFPPEYRYYGIRAATRDENGDYIWISGFNEGVGHILPNRPVLIDMDLVPSENNDGTFVRKPAKGSIISEMNHGDPYVVVFFDNEFIEIENKTFTAISVRHGNIEMVPNMAVQGLKIMSNRYSRDVDLEVNGGPIAELYLYKDEIPQSSLIFRVGVKYTDGTVRDVTHENTEGGRLVIETEDSDGLVYADLNGIDSSVVDELDENGNPIGETNNNINVRYILVEATDENGNTPLTIEAIVPVVIRPNPYAKIIKLIPIVYKEDGIGTPPYGSFKFYGVYDNGSAFEITNKVQTSFNGDHLDTIQYFDASVQQYMNGVYDQITNFERNYVTVKTENNGKIVFNVKYNMDDAHPLQFVGEYNQVGFKMHIDVQPANFQFRMRIDNGDGTSISPTHFRIWDKNKHHCFAGETTPIEVARLADPSFLYNETGDYFLTDEQNPILIEGLYLNNETGAYNSTDIRQLNVSLNNAL